MCCMCHIFVRILFLAHCWVRMVSNWSLNLTSLCSQRMACTWERVILAMGYSKLIWFGLDSAFAFTIACWGFFCFNYYIFWSNAATIYVLFIKHKCWLSHREQCIHALFTDPQILLFNNFFIKNGSHGTIHIFKNYFATVFLVFNFNKINSI